MGDDSTEENRKQIKLYLANTKTQCFTELIAFLDSIYPKTMSNAVLRSYYFQKNGITQGSIIYHLTLQHFKGLLRKESFARQEQYFFQVEQRNYYFDVLALTPYIVCSILLPKNIFVQRECEIISFCKKILVQHNGYYGVIVDEIKLTQGSTFLSYAELQQQKYLSPIVYRQKIQAEIYSAFFNYIEQYDCLFFNHCVLPNFDEHYFHSTFCKKIRFGEKFCQLKLYY